MFPDHSRTTNSNSAIARVTWFFGYKTALATVIYLTGNRDQLKNQTAMAVRKNGGKWGKWRELGGKKVVTADGYCPAFVAPLGSF